MHSLNLDSYKKDIKFNVVACIPVYNEQETIGEVVYKSSKHVNAVIVCDDGSSDSTSKVAKKFGAIVIKHKKNIGYGAAIRSLLIAALRLGADIIITLDGDGQHEPSEIPRLTKKLTIENADIVIGSRFSHNNDYHVPRYRKIGIKFITRLVNLGLSSTIKITDAQSGFRAYSKRVLKSMVLTDVGMGASTEILFNANKNNMKIVEVPVKVKYDHNSSTYNPVLHGFNVVLNTIIFFIRAR